MVQLFDASSISTLPWPSHPEADYARRFLIPFMQNGPQTYIENLSASLYALLVDEHVIPVTVSDVASNNCFVCSPSSFYGGFSKERIAAIKNNGLRHLLNPVGSALHKGLERGHVDKVAYINNWLLSTNLYPDLTQAQMEAIRDTMIAQFPGHAIGFRSINEMDTLHCFKALAHAGFQLVATRPVYFVDTTKKDHYTSRMFKSDLKILKSTDYEILEGKDAAPEDIARIVSLYRMLYVDKYSKLNPMLTEDFIRLAIDQNLLHVKLLKKEKRVDGVLGFISRYGVINSPLFGYDTTLPKELGLYRMISTLLSLEAKERGLLLNLSSGAGGYKTLRRAKPYIEYNAVYTKHLTFGRRIPWTVLQTLMNRVASPLMVKLDR